MPENTAPTSRLLSLDALRGFDMCWILGLSSAVLAMLQRFLPDAALTRVIKDQFEHVDWVGFHFEDLIFPLFLFLSGVSMAIALPKRVAREGRAAAVKHLLLRAATIFFLGVIFSGGFKDGIDGVRWMGVIQRIGIAGAAAGLLSLWLGHRGLAISTIAILIGYWLMLALIPVPGFGAGDYSEGHNLTNYLDSILLPGRKYDGDHDPEGLLSNLPAVSTALIGILAGQWLVSGADAMRKLRGLLLAGIALLLLGWAWHPLFPVVKKLWSSSFVLVAAGWSTLLLAIFYWVIDVRGLRAWCQPFVWVGANPLSLYLIAGMGAFRAVNPRLIGSPSGDWKWIASVSLFGLMLLTARWLYKRGILLRV
jgi:predicted acyltransferase